MKHPLIRSGSGTTGLEQVYAELAEQQHQVNRMLATATSSEEHQEKRRRGVIAARSGEGDQRRLRGIPAIGPGVTGSWIDPTVVDPELASLMAQRPAN